MRQMREMWRTLSTKNTDKERALQRCVHIWADSPKKRDWPIEASSWFGFKKDETEALETEQSSQSAKGFLWRKGSKTVPPRREA